jgi:hypothetical protein
VSAHSASQRGSWLSALVAQVSEFVFEEIEETIELPPAELEPYPVVAVVSAAARSGASTVARMLAAELAMRADGAAVMIGADRAHRGAPPARAAIRLATALTGAVSVQPVGRLCVARLPAAAGESAAAASNDAAGSGSAASTDAAESGDAPSTDAAASADTTAGASTRAASARAESADAAAAASGAGASAGAAALANAARYLAPVVIDLPPDGSAAGIAGIADRVIVVAAASAEPALLDAVALVIGGAPIKVVNRVVDPDGWEGRADLLLPDSRLAARAAAIGTRPLGSLGSAIARLADALEADA